MNYGIDWKKVAIFALVALLLVLATGSFLMSAGIFLLLFVADYFISEWESRRKSDKDE